MNPLLRTAVLLAAFALFLSASAPGALAQEFCPVESTGPAVVANSAFRLQDDTVIPVVFHVITHTNGDGEVTLDQIEDQITVLNAAFAFCPICEGGSFSFELLGVSRVTNDDWFLNMDYEYPAADAEVKQALSVDPAHVLNVYTVDLDNDGKLGYSTFPFPSTYPGGDTYPGGIYVDTEDHFWHGIVLDYRVLPGGDEPGRGSGDILVHEAGHYLGLYHTWQSSCDGDAPETCATAGDLVCDTPQHREPNYVCELTALVCDDGPNPIENFMNNTPDACMGVFTADQYTRMLDLTGEYRPSLGAPPPTVWGTHNTGPDLTHTYPDGTEIEGEDVHLLAGAALNIEGTVTFDADASATPANLLLSGALVGETSAVLIFRGGSEFVVRPTGDTSGYEGKIIFEGSNSCLLAEAEATLHLSGQMHTFTDGAFFASKGGTYVLNDGASIVTEPTSGTPQLAPGTAFLLGMGARITFKNAVTLTGTEADPITFGRLDPLAAWDRIYIDGANSLLRQVDIDGATVGIEVSALNATIRQVDLTNNGKGILTDYVNCPTCINARSELALESSTISNSTGVGLHLCHANATIDQTTISDSASHGILIEDSDVVAFTNNTVTGNGTVFGQGITINSGGDLTMGPATGYGGNNVVIDNVNHETKVSTGGTMLVGTPSAGGDNSIYKSNNSPSGSGRYINNASGPLSLIPAENT